jgi:ABC-2 type transport system ATP-binding protein
MAAGPALSVHGLRKSYGGLLAVESLNFEVAAGLVLGFLGPNGAGKTTAIRMLSTILSPDAGSFTVAGVPHTRPAEIRRRIGVLPESAGYPQGQTGEEWLTFHGRLFGQSRATARATARRLLAEVGLGDRASTLVSGYSRGMRQRLGIARALLNDPQVVFLDEPTLGLDPSGQLQMLELVRRMVREHGVTVVLTTHMLAEVEQTCDRVVIMNRGRVVADGTVAEIAQHAVVRRRGVLRVPPTLRTRAVQLLNAIDLSAAATGNGHGGEVEVRVPAGIAPEDAATRALRGLLEAEVPVLGLELDGDRLSDAFLAVTEES